MAELAFVAEIAALLRGEIPLKSIAVAAFAELAFVAEIAARNKRQFRVPSSTRKSRKDSTKCKVLSPEWKTEAVVFVMNYSSPVRCDEVASLAVEWRGRIPLKIVAVAATPFPPSRPQKSL